MDIIFLFLIIAVVLVLAISKWLLTQEAEFCWAHPDGLSLEAGYRRRIQASRAAKRKEAARVMKDVTPKKDRIVIIEN